MLLFLPLPGLFYGNLANAVTPFSSYTYESAPSGVTLIKEIYHLSPDCSTPITSSSYHADFPTDRADATKTCEWVIDKHHGSIKDAWCDMSDPIKPKLHVKFYFDPLCGGFPDPKAPRILDSGECKRQSDSGVKFTCLAPPSPPSPPSPPPKPPAIPMWAHNSMWANIPMWAGGVVVLAVLACVCCFCRGPRGPNVGSPDPGQRQLPALGEPLNAGLLPVSADPGLSRAMPIPASSASSTELLAGMAMAVAFDRGQADNNPEAVMINLKSLLDAGILTPEEFEAKKAEVLKEFARVS